MYVPVPDVSAAVASSGAGSPAHFVDVFRATDADAALAAGIFHRREVAIGDVKAALASAGVPVRVDAAALPPRVQ